MITGGSSSGVAVAVQGLCQEAGVIFMAGLTHSNDTTGKDKKANGFRHFFNAYMSGAALAPVLANALRHRPQGLSPDRRLHLGLDTSEESIASRDRGAGLGDGQQRADAARRDRLLVLHRAGPELGRRRAGPEPLRRQHGQLADQRRAVRPARQAGQRQEVRDRRAALLRADGARRRREHQGHLRLAELGLEARERDGRPLCGTNAFVQVLRRRSTASRPARRRRPATCRRCSMPMRSSARARSTPAPSSRRSRASSSTAWATARRSTAPPITSASRTCWSCRARRTRDRVRPLEIVEVTPVEQVTYEPDHPMFAGGDARRVQPGRLSRHGRPAAPSRDGPLLHDRPVGPTRP